MNRALDTRAHIDEHPTSRKVRSMQNARRSSGPQHPFGELLTQYRLRKPGLTQTQLAGLAGYDQAILVRMGQGKKDLTGPSGRERILRLASVLLDLGALSTLDEVNGLLLSATMPPLFDRQPAEAALITRLARAQTGHLVRRTNLPAPLTRFIGRAQEIADVRAALADTRLLTLTGAGGAGKTRLAQRVAGDRLLAYADGVWYVELAALTDPQLIADSVARVFNLATRDTPALDQVIGFLRDRHFLLVLDNCEQLIEGAAEFAVALLSACPRGSLLLTSREPINVAGEIHWRVPPMRPDEAAQLFIEHARATRRDLAISAGDLHVAHICQRLDGIPLAIEMAAAQVASRSVAEVAAALDAHLALAMPGHRAVTPRHRTLRATLDWSFRLLTPQDQALLARASVFAGDWTDEAARAVCAEDGLDASACLARLVQASLVVTLVSADRSRYRLTETVRQYAHEKLLARSELASTRDRHLTHYLAGAEAEHHQSGPQLRAWQAEQEADIDNLRAAFEWACETAARDRGEAALRLTTHLRPVFQARWRHTEFRRWIERALALGQSGPASLRSEALRANAIVLIEMGRLREALPVTEEALRLFTPDDVSLEHAWAIAIRSRLAADCEHNPTAALDLCERALALFRGWDDAYGIMAALEFRGQMKTLLNDPAGGAEALQESVRHAMSLGLIERAAENVLYLYVADRHAGSRVLRRILAVMRRANDSQGLAAALVLLAACLVGDGQHEEAAALLRESTALGGEHMLGGRFFNQIDMKGLVAGILSFRMGNLAEAERQLKASIGFSRSQGLEAPLDLASFHYYLAHIALARLDVEGAQRHSLEGLRNALRAGHDCKAALAIAQQAQLAQLRGEITLAGRLFGLASTWKRAVHIVMLPHELVEYESALAAARSHLDDAVFAAAWATGEQLAMIETADELLGAVPGH
jgi:predicted ATPase